MARSDKARDTPGSDPLKQALTDLGVDLAAPDSAAVLSWLREWAQEMESLRDELESSHGRYQELFDLSPLAYARLDPAGVILDLNLTAAHLLGKPRSFVQNTPFVFYVDPPERRAFLNYLRRCRNAVEDVAFEVQLAGPNGCRIPVEMHIRTTDSPDHGTVLYTAIFDRTEKKKAERALAASQKRLAAAVQASRVGIFEYDVPVENGYLCDERWAAVLGFSREEIPPPRGVQAWFRSRIHLEDRERLKKTYADFAKGRASGYACEARFRHQQGHWIWIKIWATATARDAEGRARHVVATLMDITEDKKREGELERRTQQLRALAAELSSAEERERRQIASELQDNLGQLLGLAEMKLDVLRQSCPDGGFTDSLREVADHLAEASETIRMLSAQASPPVLRELGLVPALEHLVREMEDEQDLVITVQKEGPVPRIDTVVSTALFLAVRELLTNVAQHARTHKARLAISHEPESARLSIAVEDDGVGFDIEPVFTQVIDGMHFGLFNIHERIAAMGGSFALESAPGRGTRARLRFPVAAQPTRKDGDEPHAD